MSPGASSSGGRSRTVDLILASQSPRRKEMLARAGFSFRVMVPDVKECPRPNEKPRAFALRAAEEKARAVAARLRRGAARPRMIIGCDTIVVSRGRIFGKPRDAAEAAWMLRQLSGRSHQVMSGLVVLGKNGDDRWETWRKLTTTTVCFRKLIEEEIRKYVASGEPMDKAGAYGIQEGAASMVRQIKGSYTNVVGMPMAELATHIKARAGQKRRCV